MEKSLRLDLIILVILIVFSAAFSLIFQVKFLVSTILYFGIPSIYLLIRRPRNLTRILTGSFLIGTVFAFCLDFLATYNHAWAWANSETLIFKQKLFGIVVLDNSLWFFLWVFFIIVFYEHFVDHDKGNDISPNIWYGLIPGLIWAILIIAIYFLSPRYLYLPYAYLILGLLALLPFCYFVYKKPSMLRKYLKVAPFFIFLYLIFEITALSIGQWSFPGQYVGIVDLYGKIRFPVEELVLWIILSSSVVLSYYEFYVDDGD